MVTSLEFTNNCFYIAAGYQNGDLKVWDVKKKTVDYRSSKKYLEVSSLSWNNTNSLLAFGTSTGDIEVIDFKQRIAVASYAKKNYDGIKALKFSPYSKNVLCSGCKDGSVGLYTIQQPDLISRYWKLHSNKVTGLGFTPLHEDLVISCSLDEKLSFLDIRQKKIANVIEMGVALTCLSVAPNGYNIVTGSYFGDIKMVDTRKTDALMMKYKGHKTMVKSIDYSKVVKSHKRADSMSIISNAKGKNDGVSRLSEHRDNSILQESMNKTIKEIRQDTPLKNRNPAIIEPKLMTNSISAESKYIPDSAKIDNPIRQAIIDQKIANTLTPKLNGVTKGLSDEDKDDIKNFIRAEINMLRLDMIKEFELQRQEFRRMMEEMRTQKK